jgi:hypothetical protein
MSVSRPHAPASVAGNDAPLIGEHECPANRRRSATEGCDEDAGVKRRYPFEVPATRTGSNGGNLDRCRPARRLKRVRQNRSPRTRKPLSAARVLCAACAAHHDAPLIGGRAATSGRIAMECGDEHVGVRRALSVRAPASRTESNCESLDPLAVTRPTEERSVGGAALPEETE